MDTLDLENELRADIERYKRRCLWIVQVRELATLVAMAP
jgi:hypothetical protein